tara:strand:- start:1019 stop:1531 length:513 start_codon:yes stop_codon:yes gene_type:complete
MEIKTIPCAMFICDVPNHKKHKKKLLNLIKKMPNKSFSSVSKTDWNIPSDFKREYLDYFYKNVITPIMDKQMKYFEASKWEIANAWFQQYTEFSFHEWHNHEYSNYTNVYFLELNSAKEKTEIKSGEKKIIEYKAKEGQVITFPGFLVHRSKPVANNRKTVIAFNSVFKH